MNWLGNRGYFSADPGKVKSAKCDVCGANMVVERNVMSPTSFAEAMGRHAHLHDSFRCPNYQTTWHQRAVELLEEGAATKSQKIRQLLVNEISEILRTKTAPEQ